METTVTVETPAAATAPATTDQTLVDLSLVVGTLRAEVDQLKQQQQKTETATEQAQATATTAADIAVTASQQATAATEQAEVATVTAIVAAETAAEVIEEPETTAEEVTIDTPKESATVTPTTVTANDAPKGGRLKRLLFG